MLKASDRNDLLFALITLRNGFASQQDLLSAIDDWAHHPTRRLCDILLERGQLTSDDFDYLNELTSDCAVKKSKKPRSTASQRELASDVPHFVKISA